MNPIAQKLLVITSNSQTMHLLTMHTRNTRPMYFENNRQYHLSHLELVMSETSQSFACYLSKQQAKNQLFPEVTSSR